LLQPYSPGGIDKDGKNADGKVIGKKPESDSFNKHYNKELKVSEDEIPLVLLELNESALAYITRE
jgi:hypothetical protein